MKASREVEIRVTCKLPYHISIQKFKEYVDDAVGTMGGSYHPDAPFFNPRLRDLMKVKRRGSPKDAHLTKVLERVHEMSQAKTNAAANVKSLWAIRKVIRAALAKIGRP